MTKKARKITAEQHRATDTFCMRRADASHAENRGAKEAAQHEAEMKTKLQNPGQIASVAKQGKQTVSHYLDDWAKSYAKVNLRPSTYHNCKRVINTYIKPYIGGVALNQLTSAMVDKMFQQIMEKGCKASTTLIVKRVLSVALNHAKKYRYIENNVAQDTLTKFGKADKTPAPLHIGAGKRPYAACSRYALGNACYAGWPLWYAPLRDIRAALAEC